MSGLDPGARAGLEETLNALVPEALNHPEIVARSATRSKCSSNPLGVRIPNYTKNRGQKTLYTLSAPPVTQQKCAFWRIFFLTPNLPAIDLFKKTSMITLDEDETRDVHNVTCFKSRIHDGDWAA